MNSMDEQKGNEEENQDRDNEHDAENHAETEQWTLQRSVSQKHISWFKMYQC